MSIDAHKYNFYTGRRGYITPYANWSQIRKSFKTYSIDYYILSPTDLRLRDVSPEKIASVGDVVYNKGNLSVYKLTDRNPTF